MNKREEGWQYRRQYQQERSTFAQRVLVVVLMT
jgi:hypothetical protein